MSVGPDEPQSAQDQPSSRVAKRLLERRQTGAPHQPESEPNPHPAIQRPIQAYIPEVHEHETGAKPQKPPAKETRKLVGRELLESIDADIDDELAEAMAEMEERDFAAGPLPTEMPGTNAATAAKGDKVSVRVVDVRGDDVFVDLGGKSEGVVSILQFETPPQPGSLIDVIIDRYDDATGMFFVRRPGSSQEADWSSIQKGAIIDVVVKAVNKGGLEISSSGLRGFLPAGQADIGHLEDLSVLVGKTLRCEVTEANASSRNLVVSRKKVQQREREELAQATRATLEVGQIRDGVVRKVLDFGAFVDIGGVDGLVPVSQLSWKRVRDAREVVREGDKVKVQVLSFDSETNKLTLSLKQLFENPWVALVAQYPVGAIVTGKITRAAEFGAFVELEPGIEGLIHISELSGRRVGRVTEVVKEGDSVDVKVLEVDPEKQRIALSLKGAAAQAAEQLAAEEEAAAEEAPRPKKPSKPLKGGLGKSGPLFG